jgi:tetratricopeptide (TPR) repeat protein
MNMARIKTILLFVSFAVCFALPAWPETIKDTFRRGSEALQNRDFAQAIAAYGEAEAECRTDDCRANAANGIGFAYMKNRQWADAIPHFARAISLAPEHKVAVNNLGFCHLKLYQSGISGTPALESALAAFTEAAEIDPAYRPDNLTLAQSYIEQHRKWLAAEVARSDFPPRTLSPSGTYQSYKEAALAAEEEGDFAFAQAAYERAETAATTQKGRAAAANLRGLLALKMREPQAARDHFSRSVKLNPESKYAWNNLGATLMRIYEFGMGGKELVEESVEAFKKVAEIDNNYKPDNLNQALKLLEELTGSAEPAAAAASVTE